MKSPLERVQALVTLAQISPGDDEARTNEARNAAVEAWRLVRKHGLLVVRAEDLATFRVNAPPAEATRPAAGPAAAKTRRRRRDAEPPHESRVEDIVSNAAGEVVTHWIGNLFR